MIDAWLARYRHGVFWAIMDDISNEKAPAHIRRGAFWGWLGLFLAEWTGLEPATPGVTGRYSNQLNYHSW